MTRTTTSLVSKIVDYMLTGRALLTYGVASMSVQSEPAVRIEALAAGADLSLNSLHRAMRQGRVPPSDTFIRGNHNGGPACAWKLSTIRTWRPDVAARCQGILQALETHTLTAA